jgi:hypothetical protein
LLENSSAAVTKKGVSYSFHYKKEIIARAHARTHTQTHTHTHTHTKVLCSTSYVRIFQITISSLMCMGPCFVSIFQYIANKMQRYTVLLYLETALHVSGGNATHHQERKQLYLQHLVFVTALLLPAAIVAGSSNGLTNIRCCR